MTRRFLFFLIAGLACLAMVPVAEPKFRTFAAVLASTYGVLALLSLLDRRS